MQQNIINNANENVCNVITYERGRIAKTHLMGYINTVELECNNAVDVA